MPNLDGPLGFQPVVMIGGSLQATLYQIDADGATAMFIGDLVDRSADGNIDPASTGSPILGPIIALYDSDMVPIASRPVSTAGFALVADDVEQRYIAQEDSVGSNLALIDRGSNVDAIFGAGDTFNNRSGHEIDSSSTGSGAALNLRVIDLLDSPQNAIGANARWIVKANYHRNAIGTVGAGV